MVEVAYYNLAGGINQSLTKTELGTDTKKIYWADSENIQIYQNRGIVKQNGNTLLLELEEQEKITGLFEMINYDYNKLIITTESGKIYIYDEKIGEKTLLTKRISGKKPQFTNFLNGTLVITESDSLFYIKNNSDYEVEDCNLNDLEGNPLYNAVITVYKGRVWAASKAVIYYSALGMYNDFTTAEDAGYIREFHTDTGSITALKTYKDYLAIYKKDSVYLLTGSSPSDFAIVPFASKGAVGQNSIINVNNKQYFLCNGIFALEQVGELNQLQVGNEISLNIKKEFLSFSNLENSIALHYENKSQMWYFFPYRDDNYFHIVWINDYINRAWYKRVIPQNITTSCIFSGNVLTADENGKIYKEDYGTSFNGKPIEFMWKSPFLSITSPHHRKTIDEFYFLLDTEYDNDFKFSVYKDYESEYSDDIERIISIHKEHLVWANDDDLPPSTSNHWGTEDEELPVWSVNKDTLEKAEISEANYAVQLCVEGKSESESCAIIGLQFREVYNDD